MTVAQAPATPVAPAILFIHGYAQAALSWVQQMRGAALAREFRMVALDLRGHGMSDKPIGHEHYRTNQFWADDIRAVIEQKQLDQPTLVGRSYGGRVMSDYVNEHGTGAIGAMNWVGAVSSSLVASRFGRGGRFMGSMTSPDPASAIAGTISFLRECFTIQPGTSDFEAMLAFNMMVPRHVRSSLGGRQVAFEQRLHGLDVPTLITHGRPDKLIDVSMGQRSAAIIPGARLSIYEHIGHAPVSEEAPRFNRELAELARAARR